VKASLPMNAVNMLLANATNTLLAYEIGPAAFVCFWSVDHVALCFVVLVLGQL